MRGIVAVGDGLERGKALRRSLALAAIAAASFVAAGIFGGGTLAGCVDYRALSLVTVYASVLVLGRFSPGRCTYRLLVLNSPGRHAAGEVGKAVSFIGYAGTRLLFAGLIFTLAGVARVLAEGGDAFAASSALALTLNSALYAFILYLIINRSVAAARRCETAPDLAPAA